MLDLSLRVREFYYRELERTGNTEEPTVAYACPSFPAPVLAGMGIRPLRLPLSRREPPGDLLPGREDICPLIDQLLSAVRQIQPQAVVGMHTCDMTRRFFQESHKYLTCPVHSLQLPSISGEHPEDFFAGQVTRVCDDLLRNGIGVQYSSSAAERYFISMRQAGTLLSSLAPAIPPVALQYFYHLLRLLPPESVVSFVDELAPLKRSSRFEFRLILTGSPLVPGDDVLSELVESYGGSLIPVGCSGESAIPEELPDNFSIEEIARCYFRAHNCIRRRPNTPVYQRLEDRVKTHAASGIILKTLPFCDLWYTEKVRMKEKMNVPVLVLNAGTAPGEAERSAVRIESFLQSLEAVRK